MKKILVNFKVIQAIIIVLLSLASSEANSQIITTIAGASGPYGFSGDGGPAILAHFNDPDGLAVDNAGNLYVNDAYNYRVRVVNPSGIINTLAGSGTVGYLDGPPGVAKFNTVAYIACDGIANVYVSDVYNHVIRKIDIATGYVSTFAGTGFAGYTGDGAAATAAQIGYPSGIEADAIGNVYFADPGYGVIRKVNPLGIISTYAGTGTIGYTGDGGNALLADLESMGGICLDGVGNLYVTQTIDNVVRRITAAGGIITTYAGDPIMGGTWTGDGGAATDAGLNSANDVTVDVGGNLYITDYFNNRIRKVTPAGIISTYAGSGSTLSSGDGGPAIVAGIAGPDNITHDCGGHLYVAEDNGNRVRVIDGNHAPHFTGGTAIDLDVCENASITIDALLSITDADLGQTETWTIGVMPTNGVLTGFPTTAIAGVGAISPSGLFYTPTPGFSGTDNFTIIITDCGGKADTTSVTVHVGPLFPPITGTTNVCVGSTSTLADASIGGAWTSSNVAVATVGISTGVVTGVSAGVVTITYTQPCGFVTTSFTVNPLPTAIFGPDSVCIGSSITLHDTTTGGAWTASNTNATVGAGTGIVTGVAAGIDTIYYTTTAGCVVSFVVTINPLPSAITGTLVVCEGGTTTLTDALPGGNWTSSNNLIATVGLTTGIVTGILPGIDTITYTLPTGCSIYSIVTVNPIPAPITGPDSVCVGSTIILHDAATGGTWGGGMPAIITVSGTGTVTGNSAGIGIVSYTLGTGCKIVDTITVNPLPAPISGSLTVCVGRSDTLTDAGGGTWHSSTVSVATIGSGTGIVVGISPGTDTITYTLPTGCSISAVITVNPTPLAISGFPVVCVGTTDTLTDPTPGGTWSSSNSGIASVLSTTGVVTGVSSGTATISYILPTGCFSTMPVSVDSLPLVPPIIGPDSLCIGDSITLTDTYPGGFWVSMNPTIASVPDYTVGKVKGLSMGLAVIYYGNTNYCGYSAVYDTIVVVDSLPPITGILAVCSGSTDTLHNFVAGGIWTSSNTSIATVNASTGVVTGVSGGTVIISYSATGPCGPFVVTASLLVNMAPFITTNTIVACQTLATSGTDGTGSSGGVVSGYPGCIEVCDSSIVRYYAHGVSGSVYSWVLTGGILIANYGDSIDVFWPITGTTGSLTLYDSAGHCSGVATVPCIKVIAKPHADFSASTLSSCLGDNIYFFDHSTADSTAPIVSWYWNFGDSTGSTIQNTTHAYTSTGTYTVVLVVKNSCGCSDTFRTKIHVFENAGPKIQCASIICDSGLATYTTLPDGCGIYNWSVTGGTILSGLGTTSIIVKWDHVSSDGFGYVHLMEPCALCPDTVTIKIPVILQNATIEGPGTACAGEQFEYELPLWAATQYHWGVLGYPTAIVGYNDNYKVVVQFPGPGTYTLHGWYQNRIMLCGGNIDRVITVVPQVHVIGQTSICAGNLTTYSLPGITSGSWVITDSAGTTIYTNPGSNSISYNFMTSGTYHLSVTGGFCAPPLTIIAEPFPPLIDSIKGTDTVCLGRVYTYAVSTHAPGYICNWQITGGTIVPASGSDSVTVVWTSSGTKQLNVNLVSTIPPYCEGNITTLDVIQEINNPVISGAITVCANSQHNYNCSYTRGEVYDWLIIPNTAGSIVTGDHTPNISVLWNNFTSLTTASIVVKVRKCDVTVSDTLVISIHPSPAISLTATTLPVCPNTLDTFIATSGGALYTFSWGDGTPNTIGTSSNVTHYFPNNPTTSNIIYHITVSVTPGGGGCPPIGMASLDVPVKPGPIAYASTADNINLCPGSHALIVGTVTNNVTGLSYQWIGTGVPPGSTDTFYTTYWASLPTTYGIWFRVTASNGCATSSNSIIFHNLDSCGVPGTGTDTTHSSGTGCPTLFSATSSCGLLTLQALPAPLGPPITGTWHAETTPPAGPLPPLTNPVSCIYNVPGIYKFNFLGGYSGCHADTVIADTVGIIPDFRWKLHCGTGGFDSVYLMDLTAYLPWWHIDSIAWYNASGIRVGGGSNLGLLLAAPGSYTFTEHVYGTDPDGLFNCTATHTVNLPGTPSAAFTDAVSPICETLPISFTPTFPTGIVNFSWNFGDGSGVLISNPGKAYNWTGPGPIQTIPVTLSVGDSIGCTATFSQNVQIYHNLLNGGFTSTYQSICSSDAPLLLLYTPGTFSTIPTSYLWNDGQVTNPALISVSGAYWVTVKDAHQCQKTFPNPVVEEVRIIRPPVPSITGKQNYCNPDAVTLSGYLGTGVTYNWLRNNLSVSTGPTTSTGDLIPDDYYYQLIIGVFDSTSGLTCYDTSATDTIHMYAPPPLPVITGPTILDCNTYQIQLAASDVEIGYFNWSDGRYGAFDTINSGGPYRVWFTDTRGCVSHSDVNVPLSPEYYFQYFPSGCYSICNQQLPLLLYGPPDDSFSYWAWMHNAIDTAFSGSGLMLPYSITTAGTYQWALDNGLCAKTSDEMDVTVDECSQCKQTRLAATATCTPGNPASYSIVVSFNSPGPGSTYTLGTDVGPIDPFSGTLGGGSYSLTLTFTTLLVPPPDSITVEISFRLRDGSRCFQQVRIPLPTCTWIAEKQSHTPDSTKNGGDIKLLNEISSALLVFPNPSSGDVTASYEYGMDGYANRSLTIYDAVGRKMAYTAPQDSHGNWLINTNNWAVGIYIIQMTADGKTLQTQRIVITGH